MLPDGSHVGIGPYNFRLAEEIGSDTSLIRPHYMHTQNPVISDQRVIPGEPGAANLRPEYPLWSMDDWSGGIGTKFITDPSNQETVFDNGNCNPRVPGQLTGPPARTTTDFATPASTLLKLIASGPNIWARTFSRIYYSTDGGANYTLRDAANVWQIDSMASDGKFVYWAGNDGANRIVRAASTGTAGETVSTEAGTQSYLGLAYRGPFLYAWNPGVLREADASAMTGAADALVWTTRFSSGQTATPDYADATTSDNSVLMFATYGYNTYIYEFTGSGASGVGAEIWHINFQGTCFAHALGILYVAGVLNGRAALYGMSMTSRSPVFLGYIGQTTSSSYTPASISAGPGAQVLIGMSTGEVFIYDEDANAFSMLDNVGSGTSFSNLTTVMGFQGKRYAGGRTLASTTIRTYSWGNDQDTPPITSFGYQVNPGWTLGYPEEDKLLLTVHTVCKPLSGDQCIRHFYTLEEAGTNAPTITSTNPPTTASSGWVSLPAITTATTGATTGNVVQTISVPADYTSGSPTDATVRYRVLRTATALVSGTAVGPTILSTTWRSDTVQNYEDQWEIVLDIHDSEPGPGNSIRKAKVRAETVRNYLIGDGSAACGSVTGICYSKKVVQFRDGYRFNKTPKQFTTHNVTATLVSDNVRRDGQGNLRLLLRSVASP